MEQIKALLDVVSGCAEEFRSTGNVPNKVVEHVGTVCQSDPLAMEFAIGLALIYLREPAIGAYFGQDIDDLIRLEPRRAGLTSRQYAAGAIAAAAESGAARVPPTELISEVLLKGLLEQGLISTAVSELFSWYTASGEIARRLLDALTSEERDQVLQAVRRDAIEAASEMPD